MKIGVLLGDSIRLIGYGPKVPEILGSDYVNEQEAMVHLFADTARGQI